MYNCARELSRTLEHGHDTLDDNSLMPADLNWTNFSLPIIQQRFKGVHYKFRVMQRGASTKLPSQIQLTKMKVSPV